MKRQILICLDDSPTSFQALLYVAELFRTEPEVDIQLLHCHGATSTPYPQPEDHRQSLVPDISSSKAAQKGSRLLEKAKAKLLDQGLAESRVSTCCQPATNVAQAIHQIGAHQLVDAIVLARRGVGIVGELLLGSVSSALFDKCRNIPLWIIDGDIRSHRFLVPVDGTPNSLMAIDHLAHIFRGRGDVTFYLLHVRGFLSSPPVCKPETFYDRWGKEWCDTHLSGGSCMFTGPTDLLADSDIPRDRIITLPQPTAIEESTAIINAAKKNDCGTIVIGRRPEREVKSIFGGVSKRTILQAENLALWVIG